MRVQEVLCGFETEACVCARDDDGFVLERDGWEGRGDEDLAFEERGDGHFRDGKRLRRILEVRNRYGWE